MTTGFLETPESEKSYGYVTCRIIRRVADTPDDADAFPNILPAEGKVIFTPKQKNVTASNYSALVLNETIEAPLNSEGYAVRHKGADSTLIALVVGTYDVRFNIVSGGDIPPMTVQVTSSHTQETPLDLATIRPPAENASTTVQVISVDSSVEDGSVLIKSGASVYGVPQSEFKVEPVYLVTDDDTMDTLPNGISQVGFEQHATNLGLPVADHGPLVLARIGNGGSAFFFPRLKGGIWRIRRESGVWGEWENVLPEQAQVEPVYLVTDDDTMDTLPNGISQVGFERHATSLGLPVADHGPLVLARIGNGGSAFFFPRLEGGIWRIRRNSGVWGEWENVLSGSGGGTTVATVPEMDYGLRHRYIRERHEAKIGAPIDVGSKTPICVLFDDYPAATRDNGVIEACRTHGIPLTLALNARGHLPQYTERLGYEGVTWDEINGWVEEGTVEIAHHGATHDPDRTLDEMYDEIVTGLEELRALIPAQEDFMWAMPDNNWETFNRGTNADEWAGPVGQLILGHHPYATGKHEALPLRAYPMTGRAIQGADRQWLEAPGLTMEQRKGLVTRYYDTADGAMICAHGSWFGRDVDGKLRWSTDDMQEFFAWLAAERDAGRVELMHLSRWPWAKVTL